MPVGKPLGLRLFLEGQEVPVVAAQISIGVNAPASASVQVVPVDEVLDLRPRTMVHLFYLDTDLQAQARSSTEVSQNPETRNYYRLLFAGETVGYAWAQSPQSRSVVLQCLDFSNYWDSAHASAIEFGPGGNPFFDHSAISSGNPGVFDDLVDQQPNKIVEWLKQQPKTPGLQSVTGLAGGVIRMLEAIAGIPGYHRGINDFFTFAELRSRILAQITAEENDKTARNLIDVQVMDQWIMNGLQNLGRTVTFRQMINLLFKYIYYESVPNPAAKWDAAYKGKNETIESGSYPLSAVPAGAAALKNLADASDRLNVNFDVATSEWPKFSQSIVTAVLSDLAKGRTNLRQASSTKAELKAQLVQINTKLDKAEALVKALKNQNIPTKDTFKGPKSAVDAVIEAINSATGQYKSYATKTTSQSQRLRSHIIRPDCWFAAPPRCNVIFPEYYTQFQFERTQIGEVTRSLVQFGTKLVGPDALLDNVLFPNAVLTGGQERYKNEGSYRVLMPHELHSGIIPRSEWMPDTHTVNASGDPSRKDKVKGIELSWAKRAGLFNFFKYRFAPRQMQVAMRFNPFIVCGFPSLLLRKPYIIPGLTMSKDVLSQDALNSIHKDAAKNHAPNHFIGMVGSVSHNIDQSGGVTTVLMHSVRRHQGVDDEFLDILSDPVSQVVATKINFDEASGVNAGGRPRLDLMGILTGCTPQKKASSSKKKITQRSTKSVSASSNKKTVNRQGKTTTTSQVSLTTKSVVETETAPVVGTTIATDFTAIGEIQGLPGNRLVPYPASDVHSGTKNGRFASQGGIVVGVEVSMSAMRTFNGKNAFQEVIVYEQVPSGFEQRKLPIEEVLRPPWFSPKYSNVNVGPKIYQPFFGCNSIVDDLKIQGLLTTPSSDDFDKSVDAQSASTDKTPDQVVQEIRNTIGTRQEASIEKAVNVLAFLYGRVREQGLDVDAFVRSYIDRPIATKDQILGTEDLEISVDAQGVATATRGQLGFHTAAVHPSLTDIGGMAGLVIDPDLRLPRINNFGDKSPFRIRDIRKEKADRVTAYVEAVRRGVGQRG